jgi:hypothetical protein
MLMSHQTVETKYQSNFPAALMNFPQSALGTLGGIRPF